MKDTKRNNALKSGYELYDDPNKSLAAAEIDAAVLRAANLVFTKMVNGTTLIEAVHTSLKEKVAPVMDKWQKLGAGDTEPEWNVVHVMMEHLENRLGFKPDLDGWDMRGCL